LRKADSSPVFGIQKAGRVGKAEKGNPRRTWPEEVLLSGAVFRTDGYFEVD